MGFFIHIKAKYTGLKYTKLYKPSQAIFLLTNIINTHIKYNLFSFEFKKKFKTFGIKGFQPCSCALRMSLYNYTDKVLPVCRSVCALGSKMLL